MSKGYLFDYLDWRGDISLEMRPLNEVDIAALAFIPLIDLSHAINQDEEITLEELSKRYRDESRGCLMHLGLIIPDSMLNCALRLGELPRYKDLVISDYLQIIDEEKDEQLSVVTIKFSEKLRGIIFSGTDDTCVGWKENFNMMHSGYNNAQKDGCKYIENMYEKYGGKYIVFGHSKGGNLAIVSSMLTNYETFKHIQDVYSLDGPGIQPQLKVSERDIARLSKMNALVPDGSIVGKCFRQYANESIIKSSNKGFYQHDTTSWEIDVDKFVRVDSVSDESKKIKELINSTLLKLSMKEKRRLTNSVDTLIKKNGIKTLTELSKKTSNVVKDYFKLDKDDKKLINKLVKVLMLDKSFRDTVFYSIKTEMRLAKENKKQNKR